MSWACPKCRYVNVSHWPRCLKCGTRRGAGRENPVVAALRRLRAEDVRRAWRTNW